MIIVEGADLVGKTTLCHKLLDTDYCQKHGMVYSHLSRLPPGWRHPQSYFDRACKNVVQDRFHMSEIVYSHARGEDASLLTPEKYRLVDAMTRNMGAVNVVIVAYDATIEARWGRDEMYDLDLVKRANSTFHTIARRPQFAYGSEVYRPDVDFLLYSDDLIDEEFCSKSVQAIIDLYAHRQLVIEL